MKFRLPDVGEGITEAVLLRWHASLGDQIAEDDVLCTIETDKAVVEIPAPCAGTLVALEATEGATVQIGSVIAEVAATDSTEPAQHLLSKTSPLVGMPAGGPQSGVTENVFSRPGTDAKKVVSATESDSGDESRKADISTPPATAESERVPMTRLRRLIAENMRRSVSTIPHATSSFRCSAAALVGFRKQCEEKIGRRVSFTALLMKLMEPALKQYPYFNSSLDENRQEIIVHRVLNVGFATHTEEGLIVPVVKNVQARSIAEISDQIEALAASARKRRVQLSDLRGATITLSNVGSHGGHDLGGRPIVNHPQAAIVAVGRARPEPVAEGENVRVRPVLHLTTSYDHRLIDGAYASMFMERFIADIENPASAIAVV